MYPAARGFAAEPDDVRIALAFVTLFPLAKADRRDTGGIDRNCDADETEIQSSVFCVVCTL